MSVELERRLFTVDDYHEMIGAGILSEDDRVELVEGEILKMVAIGSRHAACVKRLNRLLTERLRDRALIGVQDPIRLGELSEPEPDLSVLVPRDDFYAQAHPAAEDALLVIEVSDTSLERDRAHKLPMYARAGVRELWLIDLAAEVVEVCRSPSGNDYEQKKVLTARDQVRPLAFRDCALAVGELLAKTP